MFIAELNNVGKRYGTVDALKGVDLRVERGELVALLGPNGAGKTTAVNVLLGQRRPDMGEIRVPRSLLDDPPPAGLRVTLTAVLKEASSENDDPKPTGISDPGFIFRGEVGHI